MHTEEPGENAVDDQVVSALSQAFKAYGLDEIVEVRHEFHSKSTISFQVRRLTSTASGSVPRKHDRSQRANSLRFSTIARTNAFAELLGCVHPTLPSKLRHLGCGKHSAFRCFRFMEHPHTRLSRDAFHLFIFALSESAKTAEPKTYAVTPSASIGRVHPGRRRNPV
jgi:hypothetical protein